MNNISVARIIGYLTLFIMTVFGVMFAMNGVGTVWPHFYIFAVSSWLHGICWGYRCALEGRLTWL